MRLTKSAFLLGSQCRKMHWLHFHGATHGVIPNPLSTAAQFLVDQGRKVGQLAQQRFPAGVNLVETVGFDLGRRARETTRLIADGADVLFEAVFEYHGAVCAVDILTRDGDGWRVHEVKAGTRVREHHVLDAAFQYWVLAGCGLDIEDVLITHIDNGYSRHGDLDLNQLFIDESVLDQVLGMQDELGVTVANLQEVLGSATVPETEIGIQCMSPHDCPFVSQCWSHIPERSVFELTRGGRKRWDLYREGIVKLRDIPDQFPLTPGQKIQVQAEKTGRTRIDRPAIRCFLNSLVYPIAHIDFETTNEVVPPYCKMIPYQQLPFQHSIHSQACENGDIDHHEFLADAKIDPREPFVRSLLGALKGAETVLVYNKAFEDTRLRELQHHFPELHDEIQAVRDRLVDLMIPFQRRWYYTPEMHGSYSIKAVLPALVPELSYSDLAVSNGASASAAFVSLRDETDPERAEQVRGELLTYCTLDTWSMTKLLGKLREVSRP
jgi:hypothetical protein